MFPTCLHTPMFQYISQPIIQRGIFSSQTPESPDKDSIQFITFGSKPNETGPTLSCSGFRHVQHLYYVLISIAWDKPYKIILQTNSIFQSQVT